MPSDPTAPKKENRRRRSSAPISENRNRALSMALAGLGGAISFHLMLWLLCHIFGINLYLHSQRPPPPEEDKEERIIITPPEEDAPEPDPIPDPVEVDPLEIEPIDVDPPDIVDVPLEEVTFAPGETSLSIKDSTPPQPDLPLQAETLDPVKIAAGLPDVLPDPAYTNSNDVQVQVPDMKDLDVDKWNQEQAGPGGSDETMNPDGSKTLGQLLNQPTGSLGEGSGFARIGADLLFEFNKATLKQSAKVGLLQLAALIEKNQKTIFIIEGHTDSFGTPQYNKKLSLHRANAVRKWLAANSINLDRIYIRACGSDKPIVDIKLTKEEQKDNRRVEIHMRKEGESLPPDCINARQELPEYSQELSPNVATPTPKSPATPLPPPQPAIKPSQPVAQPPSKPAPKQQAVGAEIIEDSPKQPVPVKQSPKKPEQAIQAEVIEDGIHGAEIID